MSYMVVPWSEIPAWKWAEVGTPVAAHEFCKRLTVAEITECVI